MADIIKPDVFNERFTIRLDAEGNPVQRTLHEMNVDDVHFAICWHGKEAERELAAMPDHERNRIIDAAWSDRFFAGAAVNIATRLIRGVEAALPPEAATMPFEEAVARYWPSRTARLAFC
jgi:hypothetical protein